MNNTYIIYILYIYIGHIISALMYDFLLLGKWNKFIFVLTFPMAPRCKFNTCRSRTDNWKTIENVNQNMNHLSSCCWANGKTCILLCLLTFPKVRRCKFYIGLLRTTGSLNKLGTSIKIWISLTSCCWASTKNHHNSSSVDVPNGSMTQI